MKISALLREDRPAVSFEVFPPKTSDAFDKVESAALEIAQIIEARYGVPTLAHLTCVSSDRAAV